MTLRDFLLIIGDWLKFLKRKLWLILLFVVLGAALGFLVSRLIKTKYVATTTFVLDEQNDKATSNLAMFGLGSPDKGAGLFEGDNLKYLYGTRLMLQKVLLTSVKKGNKDILLINWLLKADKQAHKVWASNPRFKTIVFSESDQNNYSDIYKNQLIANCIGLIKTKYLAVKDVEKTSGVIAVSITSEDEQFAQALDQVLVTTVNQYYIQTKTSKATKQVKDLEMLTSQYNSKMNASLYSTAISEESIPYANPSKQVIKIAPKRQGIDANLNAELYTQLVQRLEAAKMELQKVTPLIQEIDTPVLPLGTVNKPAIFYIIVFGFLFGIGTIMFLSVRRSFLKIIKVPA